MIYAWRYPKSIHRSVMIGVNPPGHFLWDPQTTDAQIRRYSRLCAQDSGVQQADRRPRGDDARRTASDMPEPVLGPPVRQERRPGRVLLRADGDDRGRSAAVRTDDDSTPGSRRPKGDPSGLWFLSLMARMAFPESFVWGELAADEQGRHPRREALLREGPASEGLDPRQPRHRVPLRRRRARRRLAGRLRTRTSTPRSAIRTSRRCSSAARSTSRPRRSTRPGSCCRTSRTAARSCSPSSATRTPSGPTQPKASTRLLNTFFDTGKVDTSLYTPAEGRLHARGDPHRARQGLRRHVRRPAA